MSSYLKKSLDRNTTGPLASTGPSKNLRDARSSIASRSELIALLGGTVVVSPLAVRARQPMPVIDQ
jgi:hypothetical protein